LWYAHQFSMSPQMPAEKDVGAVEHLCASGSTMV
jgi:hypothetical protein